MDRRRGPTKKENLNEGLFLEFESNKEEKRSCQQKFCKYCKIITIIFVVLIVLAFILIFVVFPLVFMNSIGLQTLAVFHTFNNTPKNPEFTNFQKYNIEGARNLYITINTASTISLGVWHILPEALAKEASKNENFDYGQALAQETHPVILYFHGSNGHRITPVDMYRVLLKFFHVIAFDYRSYGDSTEADLSEEEIIQDSVQLYKWLRLQTKADIFFWGRSLGASLSTRTVKALRREKIIPMGLFLEVPFTTLKEQFPHNTIVKIFSWLLWFNVTVLDPLESNGFLFDTKQNIIEVDCPIMIVHAEDDSVVPYSMSEELTRIAQESRNQTIQGTVTFHLFPGNSRYDHWRLYEAPELPSYIKSHIEICRDFNNKD